MYDIFQSQFENPLAIIKTESPQDISNVFRNLYPYIEENNIPLSVRSAELGTYFSLSYHSKTSTLF